MAKLNRAQQYLENHLRTAGKLKSLQLLHQGCAKNIRRALTEPDNRAEYILKSQNIVAQLQMALDLRDGNIAELIFYVYDYVYKMLEKGDTLSLSHAWELMEHMSVTFRMIRKPRMMAA